MKWLHIEEPPKDLNELAENLMRDDRLWERAETSIAVSDFKLTLGGHCPELQDDLPIPQDMTWCASVTAEPADPAETPWLFTFRSWQVVPDGLRGISAQTGNVVELVMDEGRTVYDARRPDGRPSPATSWVVDDTHDPPERLIYGLDRITVIEPETAVKFPRATRPGYPIEYSKLSLRWHRHKHRIEDEQLVIEAMDKRPERTLVAGHVDIVTVSRFDDPWSLKVRCQAGPVELIEGREFVEVVFQTWLHVGSGVRGIDEKTGRLTEILYDRGAAEARKVLI